MDNWGNFYQQNLNLTTLPGTNMSHLGKRKTIFKNALVGNMLVPWSVHLHPRFFSKQKSHPRVPRCWENLSWFCWSFVGWIVGVENPTKITIQVRSYGIGILFTQLIYHKNQPNLGNYTILGGGFKHFLFSPRGGGRFPCWPPTR